MMEYWTYWCTCSNNFCNGGWGFGEETERVQEFCQGKPLAAWQWKLLFCFAVSEHIALFTFPTDLWLQRTLLRIRERWHLKGKVESLNQDVFLKIHLWKFQVMTLCYCENGEYFCFHSKQEWEPEIISRLRKFLRWVINNWFVFWPYTDVCMKHCIRSAFRVSVKKTGNLGGIQTHDLLLSSASRPPSLPGFQPAIRHRASSVVERLRCLHW